MENLSVVVIGAGPAGASAASSLAKAGVDVLLVDQCRFPRDKVCGDGLTPAALAELERLGLREAIAGSTNAVSGCALFGPSGAHFEARSESSGLVMPRERLDELLHRRACEAGAKFLEARVADLQVGPDAVTLTTAGGERLRAPLAIVASGSHSSLPLKAGLQGQPAANAVARRAYFENVRWDPTRLLFCYAKDLLPGYGWVFPLGDGRANVGVGYFLKEGRPPELDRVWQEFQGWLREQGVFGDQTRPLSKVGTAQMRTGLQRNRLVGDRLLLAGDSAAAINPLSGEGISQALRTGRFAADAAQAALRSGDFSKRALSSYTVAVRSEFANVGSYRAMKWLLQSPSLVDAVVWAARERPEVGTALYEALIGVREPKAAIARCVAGIAASGLARARRALRPG